MENQKPIINSWTKGVLGLKIHFLVFCAVNLLLFIINLTTGFRTLWFLWPLASWLIGMGSHFGTIYAINFFEKGNIKGLVIHAGAVISISITLLIFNLLTGMYYPWFLWPVIPLGAALGIHGSVVFATSRYEHGLDIGLAIHTGAFLFSGIALMFMNLLTATAYPWFLWPTLSWAIGLGIHGVTIYSIKRYQRPATRGLIIHGAVVVILSIYFLSIDLFTGFGLSWFFFIAIPLIVAWGEHYMFYRFITPQNGELESKFRKLVNLKAETLAVDQPKKIAIELIITRAAFLMHLSYYLIMSLFLFLINLIGSGLNGYLWFLWPLTSWGFVVVLHWNSLLVRRSYFLEKKPSFLLMMPGAIAAAGYFVFVDLYSNNGYNWLRWTLLGLIVFVIFYYFIIARRIKYKPIKAFSQYNPTEIIYYCPSCSEKVGEETRYCANCGTKIR